ncbi:alanine racemase [Arsenicicoccus sp. oral taxon 190]|uniref:alanine racemase n=1 Tax=Arsenicicoccus sp. oral taxon 190 TaxID=1658671 RepID=UPI00067A27BA|nr:alanine/ornithine racemase family PLP-dependent enzyme [Arsenicicoccus sp. oral taxon 190]AKT51337.1 amino acid racemase [Arsenicicoccus sp. oral taxon 190]
MSGAATPRLEIYPERITYNALSVVELGHQHGATVAGVAKVTCAHPAVVDALVAGGVDLIADSRIDNLRQTRERGIELPLMLLRISERSRAAEVVEYADISLNSSLITMEVLSDAAIAAGKRHQVILMVDVGDLREGVWPDRAVEVAFGAAQLRGIEVVGLGCNLACFGGVVPSEENMRLLVEVRDACRAATGLELPMLSGGNSASLPFLASGHMPPEINNFRMGESIILGRNVFDRSPWPGTRQDTVQLVVEVVELERKPSVPIGKRGQNAFGEEPAFEDRGTRLRAIFNVGRQDVIVDGLDPLDPNISILGASSDHLILDVEDMAGVESLRVGDEMAFYPDYAALLALSTSPYVEKVVVAGPPSGPARWAVG